MGHWALGMGKEQLPIANRHIRELNSKTDKSEG